MSMKSGALAAFLLMATVFSGCAVRLTAVPISGKARMEMGSEDGIPYYVPRPYLLVTRDMDISDSALNTAGLVVDPQGDRGSGDASKSSAGVSGAPGASSGAASGTSGEGTASGTTGGGTSSGTTGGGTSSSGKSGISSAGEMRVQAAPVYRFRVIYLPDLTRQYALQQRGGGLSNVTLKYELEGGWMFKGTEINSETRVPETIEASTTGLANILGSSLEQIFSSVFPVPTSGVSGMTEGVEVDLGPKIWLFEISEGPQGSLRVNMERPFFEWPQDSSRTRIRSRPAVERSDGRDPGASDLELPARPTTPVPPAGADMSPSAPANDAASPSPVSPEKAGPRP